ncbi:MAG: CBS domain-containing protein [Desulfarculus sp.]|nr:CBS domain-containing protein [Desulfarculus sp.]
MPANQDQGPGGLHPDHELSEQDILKAMKGLSGYLDITPGDFKEVFDLAYGQALRRLGLSIKARDLMTAPVVSVGAGDSLGQVAQVMAEAGVSGVPVLDDGGRVLGVISEKDFLKRMDPLGSPSLMGVVARCLSQGACLLAPLLEERAAQAMSAPAVTLGPEATLAEISALFSERGINRAPVVDRQGRPLGMVSRGDLLGARAGRRA